MSGRTPARRLFAWGTETPPGEKLTLRERGVWLADPEAGINHVFTAHGERGSFRPCDAQCLVRSISVPNCSRESYEKQGSGMEGFLGTMRNKMESSVFLRTLWDPRYTEGLSPCPLHPTHYNRTPWGHNGSVAGGWKTGWLTMFRIIHGVCSSISGNI